MRKTSWKLFAMTLALGAIPLIGCTSSTDPGSGGDDDVPPIDEPPPDDPPPTNTGRYDENGVLMILETNPARPSWSPKWEGYDPNSDDIFRIDNNGDDAVQQPDGSWLLTEFAGRDRVLEFASVPARVSLAEIYRDVTLPEAPPR